MLNIQIVKLNDGFQLLTDVTLIDEIQENDAYFNTYGEALRAVNRLINKLLIDADFNEAMKGQ